MQLEPGSVGLGRGGLKSLQNSCKGAFAGKDSANADSGNPPLKRLLLVGARVESKFLKGFCLMPKDAAYVRDTVGKLREMNIPVAPDFEVSLFGKEAIYERDFLQNREEGDVVVFCYLPNPPKEQAENLRYDDYMAVSSDHYDPDIWYETTRKTGAKIVAVVGLGDHDLSPRHFLREGGQFEFFSPVTDNHVLLIDRNYRRQLPFTGASVALSAPLPS
jgi:hypothetical protein